MGSNLDRNVVVTGAAGGMGAAAVRLLSARGVNVLAVDRDGDRLQRAEETFQVGAEPGARGEVATAPADVGVAADVQRVLTAAVDRWGGLDGIFNVAAVLGEFARMGDASEKSYDAVMAVNAKSVWLMMRHGLPLLVQRGGGCIVNTGSHLAWHGGEKLGAYTASKHAVIGLTRTAAIEYARQNVRVNAVCPASMDTQMGYETEAGYDPEDPGAVRRAFMAASPNGRIGRPEEAAAVGVWLLLDAPAHVNGMVIPVDGGRSAV